MKEQQQEILVKVAPQEVVADDVQSSSSRFTEAALACVPEKNMVVWNIINSICCIWSVILFIQILAGESSLDKPHGDQLYMIWSFGTTLVWCVETGLSTWYHGSASSWAVRIELALAIYFFIWSILLFRQWRHPDLEVEDELWDVVIAVVAYTGIIIYNTRAWWKRKCCGHEDDVQQEDSYVEMGQENHHLSHVV